MPDAHSLLLFVVAGLARMRRGMHWLECGAGALFIDFGIRLALAENPGPNPSVH